MPDLIRVGADAVQAEKKKMQRDLEALRANPIYREMMRRSAARALSRKEQGVDMSLTPEQRAMNAGAYQEHPWFAMLVSAIENEELRRLEREEREAEIKDKEASRGIESATDDEDGETPSARDQSGRATGRTSQGKDY